MSAHSPPKHPSPLRESTLWQQHQQPPASPSTPQRNSILTDSSKGWSPLRIQKRASNGTPTTASLPRSNSSENDLENPRRTSSSFKQLSRGLVSNSVFKRSSVDAGASSPSSLRESPVIPRVSRVNNPVLPSPTMSPLSPKHGLGISEPAHISRPRESDSFTGLGTKSLVTQSVFQEDPSASSLASPKRMTGPRTLQSSSSFGELSSMPLSEKSRTHNTSSDTASSGSSSTRSRSKTVTFSEEEQVREFERAEYENLRESVGSQNSAATEEEEDSMEAVVNGGVHYDTPQEMVNKLLREEELANQARRLSLAVQEADNVSVKSISPPAHAITRYDESPNADESPVIGQPLSPSRFLSQKRPLPTAPVSAEHSMDFEYDTANTSVVDKGEDGTRPQSQTSPMLYWDEGALETQLKNANLATSPVLTYTSQAQAPVRSDSLKNGRPKITREGIQERLRLKQLGALHEKPQDTSSSDPIKNLLSATASVNSFSDEQLKSPLERLGSNRYNSPSVSSFSAEYGTVQAAIPLEEGSPDSSASHAKSTNSDINRGSILAPSFSNESADSDAESTPRLPYLRERQRSTPDSPGLKEREAALLAARRRSRSMRDEDSPSPVFHVFQEQPLTRRRSLSTGDVSPRLTSKLTSTLSCPDSVNDKLHVSPSTLAPLSDWLNAEISYIADKKRTYHLRERRVIVSDTIDESDKATGSTANRTKAWKKIRKASDMHQRAEEIRALRQESTSTDPNIFLKLSRVTFVSDFRMPTRPSYFYRIISTGDESVQEEEIPLRPGENALWDEWILPPSKILSLKLQIRQDPARDSHLCRTTSLTSSVAESALSHKNSTGGLRKLFGSPKKSRQASVNLPPPPDPFLGYVSQDGVFAKGHITFKDIEARCRGQVLSTSMPLKCPGTGAVIAQLAFKIFFLPSIPGSAELPENLEQVQSGLIALQKDLTGTTFKGELSQMGGDCTSWRRRTFELKDNQLIASNEVTKQVHAVIDLRHASHLADLHSAVDSPEQATICAFNKDDEAYEVRHSFKIIFLDKSEIAFYADDDQSKGDWFEVLTKVVKMLDATRQATKTKDLAAPLWALLMQRQLEETKKDSKPGESTASKPAKNISMATIREKAESETEQQQEILAKPPLPQKDSSIAFSKYTTSSTSTIVPQRAVIEIDTSRSSISKMSKLNSNSPISSQTMPQWRTSPEKPSRRKP